MSGMEWFFRMEQGLKARLPEIEEQDEVYIFFKSNPTEHHPTFSFFMEIEDEIYEFCVIQFDPVNQEFYAYQMYEEDEFDAKILFNDLEQLMEYVNDSYFEFRDFMFINEDDEREGEELKIFDTSDDDGIIWITNDKHLHIEVGNPEENKTYSIHLKLGIAEESGDAVLYRSLITDEDRNEWYIHFKRDEVPYVIDMLQEYVYDDDIPEF